MVRRPPVRRPGPGVRTMETPDGQVFWLTALVEFRAAFPRSPAVACASKLWPNTAAALRRNHTGFPLRPRHAEARRRTRQATNSIPTGCDATSRDLARLAS